LKEETVNRFLLIFIVALNITLLATTADRPSKPNIIIMMADDMGLGDTSAYLGVRLMPNAPPVAKTLRTPNLDAFAKQSVLFTDAHAPASMPCLPDALLTAPI
jgi:arylsulfatase A-like enzyme